MSKVAKKKNIIEDDGRTIASMNVPGLPWYRSKKTMEKQETLVRLNLMPHERRAIIFGAYLAYLPVFLIILGGFALGYILFYLWAITVTK